MLQLLKSGSQLLADILRDGPILEEEVLIMKRIIIEGGSGCRKILFDIFIFSPHFKLLSLLQLVIFEILERQHEVLMRTTKGLIIIRVLEMALRNLWAGNVELPIVLLTFYVLCKASMLDFVFLIAIMVVQGYSLSFIAANLELMNGLYFIQAQFVPKTHA